MASSDNELPPLLPGGSSPIASSRSSSKRSRGTQSGENTSDSAFFSGDDDLADASVDKYTSPARKKQFKRSWYETQQPSQEHTHRQMRQATRRPKDSGVYMNSDSSNSSADDGFSVDSLEVAPTMAASKKMQAFLKPAPPPAGPSDHDIVKEAVDQCLDNNNETLDLGNQKLRRISNDDLAPLERLVRLPPFDSAPYTEECLRELTPSISLFLNGNELERVPGGLCELKRLQVLTLRGNRLVELPPAIGSAVYLKELNVGMNNLRYLPWQLLKPLFGGELQLFSVAPNPFIRASFTNSPQPESEQRMQYRGSSHFVFFLANGLKHKKSPECSWRSTGDTIEVSSDPKGVLRGIEKEQCTPLYELALRACERGCLIPAKDELSTWNLPQSVVDGLAFIEASNEYGGRTCSVCHEAYVVPRVEWLEFWQVTLLNSKTDLLPYLRRACSWQCGLAAELGSVEGARDQ